MANTIILEDLNFVWSDNQMRNVINMWEMGVSLIEIAESVERNTEETFLLLLHLSRKSKIKPRKNYIWGIA